MHAEGNTQNAAKGLEWLARFVDQQYPTTLGTNRKEWAKLASCYVSDNWALERWLITRETSYGTMATFSLLSHLAAVVGRLGERASPLHQLLFAPQSQSACFLPSMPDDPRQRIARTSIPLLLSSTGVVLIFLLSARRLHAKARICLSRYARTILTPLLSPKFSS